MLTRSDSAVAQILSFVRKHKLSNDDLVNYGGAELNSPNRRISDRAHRVEECWELMARLGVKAEDLDPSDPLGPGPGQSRLRTGLGGWKP